MTKNQVSVPVDSCYKVDCAECGKTTWKGCGLHVESLMADVKDEDKCTCPRTQNGWFGWFR